LQWITNIDLNLIKKVCILIAIADINNNPIHINNNSMERRDYLLREIEKIGMMLSMIINRIMGNKDSYVISLEKQMEAEKELLLNEIGFDLGFFLSLEKADIEAYIAKFKGFNGANLEILADLMKEIGMMAEPAMKREYLTKAQNLYELSSTIDKSFSIEREQKLNEIKKELSD
jgi:hypothetical protein